MTNDRFEEWLRQAAQSYNAPPSPGLTPREEMWRRIQQRRSVVIRPWLRWGVGIAAILAVGIGIGRWTAGRGGLRPPTTVAPTSDVAYQVAATQVFSRSEALLTGFRADARRGGGGVRLDPQFALQARDLLASTRLMLDSPAGDDQHVRALLEDLELVLAQIAQLSAEPGAEKEEVNLITQGLEQRGVLTRLRTAIPAGPAPMQNQGVL